MDNTITLDAETCRRISEAKEPLRILDPNGVEVGTILVDEDDFPEELDGTEMTQADVERIMADPRRYTMEDVFKLLEK